MASSNRFSCRFYSYAFLVLLLSLLLMVASPASATLPNPLTDCTLHPYLCKIFNQGSPPDDAHFPSLVPSSPPQADLPFPSLVASSNPSATPFPSLISSPPPPDSPVLSTNPSSPVMPSVVRSSRTQLLPQFPSIVPSFHPPPTPPFPSLTTSSPPQSPSFPSLTLSSPPPPTPALPSFVSPSPSPFPTIVPSSPPPFSLNSAPSTLSPRAPSRNCPTKHPSHTPSPSSVSPAPSPLPLFGDDSPPPTRHPFPSPSFPSPSLPPPPSPNPQPDVFQPPPSPPSPSQFVSTPSIVLLRSPPSAPSISLIHRPPPVALSPPTFPPSTAPAPSPDAVFGPSPASPPSSDAPTPGSGSGPAPAPSLFPSVAPGPGGGVWGAPAPAPAPTGAVPVASSEWPTLALLKAQWASSADLSSWQQEAPCAAMRGLECDASGLVTALELPNANLRGPLPPELAALTSLQHLDLSFNEFSSSMPRAWSSLSDLQSMNLQGNLISGRIPGIFDSMPDLAYLSLGSNMLSEQLPPSLLALQSLAELDLSSNQLSGAIPEGIAALSSLTKLLLFGNLFSGPLPNGLGSLPQLETLDVSGNLLRNRVPPSLLQLSRLSYLDLSSNQFSGPLPSPFLSPSLATGFVNFAKNYFYGPATVVAGGSPFCPSQQEGLSAATDASSNVSNPSLLLNCLSYTATSACSAPYTEVQRTPQACAGFCGAGLDSQGPCGGRGTCFLAGSSSVPSCLCSRGFKPDLATAEVAGQTVTYPTCSSDPQNPPPNATVSNATSFSTGLVQRSPGGAGFNPHFRFASSGFQGPPTDPQWRYAPAVDWSSAANGVFMPPVRDQEACAGCWAMTAVDAVASASAILSRAPAPFLSAQEVVDCSGSGSCAAGGYPGDALSFIATAKLGLATEEVYPFDGTQQGEACQVVQGSFHPPVMFEAVSFYSWLGMLLAVQAQPVIASLAADSDSFRSYAGGFVYSDPSCFASGIVNHNVLVVGYDTKAAQPFWILRNSWGPDWGDGGYMQMAINLVSQTVNSTAATTAVTDAGVCGIYTTPALYPVVSSKSPCHPNPCGSGACLVSRSIGKNTCACPSGFTAVTNIDGSQSCGPTMVCALYQTNPCWAGSCVNDGKGGYSCLCPEGFKPGFTPTMAQTCVPDVTGGNISLYTVTGTTVTCYSLLLEFGLSEKQFLDNNQGLQCVQGAFLPPGKQVNVSNPFLPSCSLPYTVTPVDTCASIASTFNTTEDGLAALNPALDCSRLFVGLQICVLRGDPYELPLCTGFHTVQDGETCASIMAAQHPPLSPFDFFTMNPGLMCNNLMPTAAGDGLGGQTVCIAAVPYGALHCPKNSQVYGVRKGDACSIILAKYFYQPAKKQHISPVTLFIRYNRAPCQQQSLYVGKSVCVPRYS